MNTNPKNNPSLSLNIDNGSNNQNDGIEPNQTYTDVGNVDSIDSIDTDLNLHNYALGIEFIGTHYHGWQRQRDAISVQQTLEDALSKIANEPIEVVAAGRTDAGVHGGNMVAHFTTTAIRSVYNWQRGANSLLPNDIAIRWITSMPLGFHARFGAIARRYRYITLNQPARPAMLNKQVTHIHDYLDFEAMQLTASYIKGRHDFTSFRAAACQSNQPVRSISHANLFRHGAFIVLDIQADGFLHHMVRNLMGTLYAIGKGELEPQDYLTILSKKNRSIAPPTAQPHGLYFVNAYYPPDYQTLLPELPLTPIWLNA